MGPRVKPEDDEGGEVDGKSLTLEIGGNAHPIVILGLDPRTHAVTLTKEPAAQKAACQFSLSHYRSAMTGYVYMTASQKGGTIYIGVINDLGRRIPEHKEGKGSRFTAKYGVQRLIWYEEHFDIRDAIQREKSLKRWYRQWKVDLIEKTNPEWHELFRGTGW